MGAEAAGREHDAAHSLRRLLQALALEDHARHPAGLGDQRARAGIVNQDHASIPRGFQKASRERIAIGEMLASRATEPPKEIAPPALPRPPRPLPRADTQSVG